MVEHVFVAGLQLVPVGPLPQSGSSVATLHCLHTPDGPGFTQRWLFGAATLPQSAFAVQGAQALVESSQRAAVAVVHDAGVHVHVLFVSHAGVEGVVLHAPVSIPMQGTHRCIATLHTGVAASPAQSVLALHCTQSCEIGSHTAPFGFPTQSEAAAHSPQTPAATHTGVVPEQAGLQSVASGGVKASRPLSGLGGSKASRPGASRLASKRGASLAASKAGPLSEQTAFGFSAQETVSRTQPTALRLASVRARTMDERNGDSLKKSEAQKWMTPSKRRAEEGDEPELKPTTRATTPPMSIALPTLSQMAEPATEVRSKVPMPLAVSGAKKP